VETNQDPPKATFLLHQLLEPPVTSWGITRFPPFVESQMAVVRVLLSCITVAGESGGRYLNEFTQEAISGPLQSLHTRFSSAPNAALPTLESPQVEMLTASTPTQIG